MVQEIASFLKEFYKSPGHNHSSFKRHEGYYKCYKRDSEIFTPNREKLLSKLQDVKLLAVYLLNSESAIKAYEGSEDTLIRIEDSEICIHNELKIILIYYLIDYCKDGIQEFIENLDTLIHNRPPLTARINGEARISFEDFKLLCEKPIKQKELIYFLFSFQKRVSNDSFGDKMIQIGKIEKALERIDKDFNFSVLDLTGEE